ncbi:TOBE domain-containing protein [Neisseria sp. Ec49-e6-T10]|uniref:TOBE domain-containing protein n=1 Tax=Neisseria sp. Ec49-e6-T10 TaxID=3140744 RepID=UPI003EBAA4FA
MNNIQLHGSIWVTSNEQKLGGSNHIILLEKIAEYGSITQAAKAAQISYKTAWDIIETMNNLSIEPLVERVSGGKGGGGTQLTQRGKQLIKNFRLIEQEHNRFLQSLKQQAENITEDYLLIERMNMKTSARNQFYGKIIAIKRGAINDEVELTISEIETQKIVAVITHESTEKLGLKIGSSVIALIKSSSIILITDVNQCDNVQFSARNNLSGIVSRIQVGAINSEVVLDLSHGISIAVIITNESCSNLNLTIGQQAMAIFKASSVILGVQTV